MLKAMICIRSDHTSNLAIDCVAKIKNEPEPAFTEYALLALFCLSIRYTTNDISQNQGREDCQETGPY